MRGFCSVNPLKDYAIEELARCAKDPQLQLHIGLKLHFGNSDVDLGHILCGSDGYGGGNLAPREAWAAFLQLPLSDDEFRMITNNIAPLK